MEGCDPYITNVMSLSMLKIDINSVIIFLTLKFHCPLSII